jgi:hypothetical protein
MKFKLLFVVSLMVVIVPHSYAASESECAIWLCLPSGFSTGCSSAKSAFKKRIKKGKSPLPSLGACLVGNKNDNFDYRYNTAAAISEHEVCDRYESIGDREECVEWRTIPAHIKKNARCKERKYCQNLRYIDIFINGQQTGETYYWSHYSF